MLSRAVTASLLGRARGIIRFPSAAQRQIPSIYTQKSPISTTFKSSLRVKQANPTPEPISAPNLKNTIQSTAKPPTTTPDSPLPTTFPKFQSTQEFLQWYHLDPPQYQRYSQAWWLSNSWLMLMYAITGSTALFVVRGILKQINIDASLFHGDFSHRLIYFLLMTPAYTVCLICMTHVFGRRKLGDKMRRRMLFFLPKK